MYRILKVSRCFAFAGFLSLSLSACNDAPLGKITVLGDRANVECYSEDRQIFSKFSLEDGHAQSRIDGNDFRDSKTGKFMVVSGKCTITYIPD